MSSRDTNDGVRGIRVGLLAPMPSELQPLVNELGLTRDGSGYPGYTGAAGPIGLLAAKTGIGTTRAAAATERMLESGQVDHVMVVGIAGGMGPSRVGEVVLPEVVVDKVSGAEYRPAPLGPTRASGRLVTHDDFDMSDDERDALVAGGFVAVDMETAAVARVCTDRDVPWSVVRSISDLVGVTPGDVIDLANPDGSPNVAASLRYLVTKPWRIPRLVRLGLDARNAAAGAAAEAARQLRAAGAGT